MTLARLMAVFTVRTSVGMNCTWVLGICNALDGTYACKRARNAVCIMTLSLYDIVFYVRYKNDSYTTFCQCGAPGRAMILFFIATQLVLKFDGIVGPFRTSSRFRIAFPLL